MVMIGDMSGSPAPETGDVCSDSPFQNQTQTPLKTTRSRVIKLPSKFDDYIIFLEKLEEKKEANIERYAKMERSTLLHLWEIR